MGLIDSLFAYRLVPEQKYFQRFLNQGELENFLKKTAI